MIKFVMSLAVLAALSGCATQVLDSTPYESYTTGKIGTATVGEPFLIDQSGSVRRVKRWVGILNSPDGWKIDSEDSGNFLRKELIYSGKSGNTIEVSYREYRSGMAAPAFFQNVKYDLSESPIIRFQKYRIEILNATNQDIKYIILPR